MHSLDLVPDLSTWMKWAVRVLSQSWEHAQRIQLVSTTAGTVKMLVLPVEVSDD